MPPESPDAHGPAGVANRPPIPAHWDATISACLAKDPALPAKPHEPDTAMSATVRQTPVAAVAAGRNHSLHIAGDGTLWAMGCNEWGQLGDGTITDRLAPVQIHP